jgi:hypothetical protein
MSQSEAAATARNALAVNGFKASSAATPSHDGRSVEFEQLNGLRAEPLHDGEAVNVEGHRGCLAVSPRGGAVASVPATASVRSCGRGLLCNKGLEAAAAAEAEVGAIGVVFVLVMAISWLAMIGICMLKDKVFMGSAVFLLTATALPLFGSTLAVLPIGAGLVLAANGSMRFAKPDSFWARHCYDENERELARRRFAGEPAEYGPPESDDLLR